MPVQRRTAHGRLPQCSAFARQYQFHQPCVAARRPADADEAFPPAQCFAGRSRLVRRREKSRLGSARPDTQPQGWAIVPLDAPALLKREQLPALVSRWDCSLMPFFLTLQASAPELSLFRRADRELAGSNRPGGPDFPALAIPLGVKRYLRAPASAHALHRAALAPFAAAASQTRAVHPGASACQA